MLLSVLKPTCVNGTAPRTADDKHSDRYYWRIAPAMRNVGGYGTWQRWEWDARATTIMVGRRSIWEQDDDGEDMVRSSLWGPPPRQKKKKRVRPAFISRIDKKSVSLWWMEWSRGRVGVAAPSGRAAGLMYEGVAA
jgi:hypothetical protein